MSENKSYFFKTGNRTWQTKSTQDHYSLIKLRNLILPDLSKNNSACLKRIIEDHVYVQPSTEEVFKQLYEKVVISGLSNLSGSPGHISTSPSYYIPQSSYYTPQKFYYLEVTFLKDEDEAEFIMNFDALYETLRYMLFIDY